MADKTGKDFDLPQASINRILRAKLPEGVSVTKGAKQAFAKAAGIFVLYVTAAANDFCKDKKRSTISADDVMEALKELDFEEFLEPLRQCREEIKAQMKNKRGAAAKAKSAKKAEKEGEDEEEDDDIGEGDDDSQGGVDKPASVNDTNVEKKESTVNGSNPAGDTEEAKDTGMTGA